MSQVQPLTHVSEAVLATNKVVRNTYSLLSMTLLFSALCAGFAMINGAPLMNIWVVLAVFIGGPFVINAFRNSAWSLLLVFLFTGFMGYVLGPIVGLYLQLPNGPQVVMSAMATTGAVFIGLSAYALSTRRDFSFMGGFLFAGLLVALLAIVANIFLQIPVLSLAISSVVVLLMCGMILYDTSRMIHGGERNYVMITVGLFVDIYVLFTHLLNLFAALSGED